MHYKQCLRNIDLYCTYVLLAIAAFYCIHVSYDHPVADAYYFISKYVIPFSNGTLEFSDLFAKRGSADHVNLFYKLFTIFNYVVFDLDYRMETCFGLMSLAAFCLMVIRCYRNSVTKSDYFTVLVGVFLAAKLASFNSTSQFSWSLVILGNTHLLIAFVAFVAVERIVLRGGSPWVLLFVIPFTVLIGASPGMLAALIVLLVVIAAGVINRDKRLLAFGGMGALVFALILLAINGFSSSSGEPGGWGKIYSFFSFEFIEFVVYSFAQPVLSTPFLKMWFGDPRTASFLIGCLWLVVNAVVVSAFILKRAYNRTVIPLCLLLLGYAFVAGVLLYRFPTIGPAAAFSARYVYLFEFNVVAVVWMLAILLDGSTSRKLESLKPVVCGGCVAGILLSCFFINHAFETAHYSIRYVRAEARQIRLIGAGEWEPSMKRLPRIKDDEDGTSILFLKKNHLSLFQGDSVR